MSDGAAVGVEDMELAVRLLFKFFWSTKDSLLLGLARDDDPGVPFADSDAREAESGIAD